MAGGVEVLRGTWYVSNGMVLAEELLTGASRAREICLRQVTGEVLFRDASDKVPTTETCDLAGHRHTGDVGGI